MKRLVSYNYSVNKDRIDYLDALRNIACFAVVMLHVAALNTYNVDFQSYEWNVFMFYESVVNWAVPLFVMISGSVMLEREYSYKVIIKKCKSIVFVFWVWSILFLTFEIIINGITPYKNMLWLQMILQGHYHMWYLIMLFGLYLIIPLIRVIVEKPVLEKAFIILSLLFAFLLPTIKDLQLMNGVKGVLQNPIVGSIYRAYNNVFEDLNYHFTVGFVTYLVIGHALAHRLVIKRRYNILLGIFFFLIGTFITLFEIKHAHSKDAAGTFMQHYQVGILMQVCGLFFLAKELSGRKIMTYLVKISPLTFGIYLLHPMILEILQKMGLTSLSFNPVIAVPVIALGIFIISGILVCVMLVLIKGFK